MSAVTVSWNDIIAECGDYRKGFVAVFRQYEGMPTDEKDGLGRTVKVTMNSFAQHVGVAEATFRRWVKDVDRQRDERPKQRSRNDLTRDVQRAIRHEPEAVVDAIMTAPPKQRDAIYDEVKLRRAGIDNSTAARKGAKSRAHEAVEPIKRAIATNDIILCTQALVEAREHLQQAIEAGALTDAGMAKITKAYDDFSFTLAEARFTVS